MHRSRRGEAEIETVMERAGITEEPGLAEGRGKQRQGRGLLVGWRYLGRTQVCAVRSQAVSICSDFLLQYSLRLRETEGDPRLKMSVAMEARDPRYWTNYGFQA